MNALSNPRNQILLGVLLMLGGDFMFSLNDAMGKWLVVTLSVSKSHCRPLGRRLRRARPDDRPPGGRPLFDVDRPGCRSPAPR